MSMASINADRVRIPREVRDAVSRHETVVITSHDRPVYAIVHPDDALVTQPRPVGRPVRDVIAALRNVPTPDAGFVDDLEEVLQLIGDTPDDPWE